MEASPSTAVCVGDDVQRALTLSEVVELSGLGAREHGFHLGAGEEEGGAVGGLAVSDGYGISVGGELDAVAICPGGGWPLSRDAQLGGVREFAGCYAKLSIAVIFKMALD